MGTKPSIDKNSSDSTAELPTESTTTPSEDGTDYSEDDTGDSEDGTDYYTDYVSSDELVDSEEYQKSSSNGDSSSNKKDNSGFVNDVIDLKDKIRVEDIYKKKNGDYFSGTKSS